MILAIPHQTGAYPEISRRASFSRRLLWPLLATFRCFPPLSDLHSPIKLIKNQKASTIKADKLKAKMSEMIISSAPAAFSSEYLGDELGSFSSCRSRYATMISTTPMNPARSDKWKLMEFAQQRLTS